MVCTKGLKSKRLKSGQAERVSRPSRTLMYFEFYRLLRFGSDIDLKLQSLCSLMLSIAENDQIW